VLNEELEMRMKRKAIAQDTVKILEDGYYQSASNKRVDISKELASCLSQTKGYEPDFSTQLQLKNIPSSNTEFEVRNETTLMGTERLAKSQKFNKIGVLNFASAKNPGGGFLGGSQAQEESLARSSGLYSSLLKCPEHYNFHRNNESLLYSDRIIYSPNCPVFRTDDGTLLEQPYLVDFITSPAPNAGAISKNQPENISKISEVLYARGEKVLSLAAYYNCDAIVLGAWGCGVFRNEPSLVAQMFADLLLNEGKFANKFKTVLFSVLDITESKNIFTKFNSRFATN
jgi:uncharacterized protein (TIGR02452 family)